MPPQSPPRKRFAHWWLLRDSAFERVRARKGVKPRPTPERDELYHLVLDLEEDGLSYNQSSRRRKPNGGRAVRVAALRLDDRQSRAIRQCQGLLRHSLPRTRLRLRVKMGAASMRVSRDHDCEIKLRVIDKEFAEEFPKCLSVILGRNPPRARRHEKTNAWQTEVSSLPLQNFLRQPLGDLARIVRAHQGLRHSVPAGFLRIRGGNPSSVAARVQR
jgi:intein-encoded DNA endonuclease-like protein